MAITTLTTMNDATYSYLIEEQIREYVRAAVTIRPLLGFKDISAAPSIGYQVPLFGSLSAAAVAVDADLTNTAISSDPKTITTAEGGVMVEIPDQVEMGDTLAGLDPYIREISSSVAALIEADCAAIFDDPSQTAGSGTVALSTANFIEAQYLLEAGNPPSGVPIAAVLHPIQIYHLRLEVAGAASAMFGAESVVGQAMASGGKRSPTGFAFNYLGTDVFQSTNVVNDTGREGLMFVTGNQGYGMFVEKYPIRVRPQRNESARSTELVGVSMYGVGEIVDAFGVGLKTAAS